MFDWVVFWTLVYAMNDYRGSCVRFKSEIAVFRRELAVWKYIRDAARRPKMKLGQLERTVGSWDKAEWVGTATSVWVAFGRGDEHCYQRRPSCDDGAGCWRGGGCAGESALMLQRINPKLMEAGEGTNRVPHSHFWTFFISRLATPKKHLFFRDLGK